MTQQTTRCNCNYAAVTKIKRIYYPKMYPTVMVLADGSTIHLRHKEPRQVLKVGHTVNIIDVHNEPFRQVTIAVISILSVTTGSVKIV